MLEKCRMKIAKIVDFTEVLPEYKNVYSFNPSVAHWKDDLYLCVYRVFTRKASEKRNEKHPIEDNNHPWLGGPGNPCWWAPKCKGMEGGYDASKFVILKTGEDSKQPLKLAADLSNSLYERDSNDTSILKKQSGNFEGIDCRLLKVETNSFIVSYNKWIYDENKKEGRMAIYTNVIYLSAEEGKVIFGPSTMLCKDISKMTEKNWSFWIFPAPKLGVQSQLYFTYNVSPKHTVIRAKVDNYTIKCAPQKLFSKGNYFEMLEKCYNAAASEQILFISVTTPAIPKLKGKNRYIGIGHVKIKWQHYQKLPDESPLYKFYMKNVNFYKHHPIFDYFMFIYEFDPVSLEIIKITDFFIPWVPKEIGYLLVFPSGIDYSPAGFNLLIFYGDHDSYCKMIALPENTVNKLLNIPVVTAGETNACSLLPGPEIVILPEICTKKMLKGYDICSEFSDKMRISD